MKRIGDFFKRIKVEKKIEPTVKSDDFEKYQITIKDDLHLDKDKLTVFKNEKEKIIQGAKELLENGLAKDMEDAIITCAVMLKGLRYNTTEKTEDGKTHIIFEETIFR